MGIADFTIAARHQMDERELAEVRELADVCNKHEGLTMRLNWGILQKRQSENNGNNDFLCYGPDGKLVGFLAMYGFFGGSEIEISGMVHPTSRDVGVFTGLLGRAAEECGLRGIKSFLLMCERKSVSGLAFLKARAAVFDHSEHRMELSGERKLTGEGSSANGVSSDKWIGLVDQDNAVRLRTAVPEDYSMLAELDALCFNIPVEEAKRYYEAKDFLSADQLFVIVVDQTSIGMIRLHRENKDILIFGFGIKPEFRGKGYGRAALRKAVDTALALKPERVALEVDCVNDTALNLYRSCGFETTATYDYYRLSI